MDQYSSPTNNNNHDKHHSRSQQQTTRSSSSSRNNNNNNRPNSSQQQQQQEEESSSSSSLPISSIRRNNVIDDNLICSPKNNNSISGSRRSLTSLSSPSSSSSSWKKSASTARRRVQLALKTSIRSLSSPPIITSFMDDTTITGSSSYTSPIPMLPPIRRRTISSRRRRSSTTTSAATTTTTTTNSNAIFSHHQCNDEYHHYFHHSDYSNSSRQNNNNSVASNTATTALHIDAVTNNDNDDEDSINEFRRIPPPHNTNTTTTDDTNNNMDPELLVLFFEGRISTRNIDEAMSSLYDSTTTKATATTTTSFLLSSSNNTGNNANNSVNDALLHNDSDNDDDDEEERSTTRSKSIQSRNPSQEQQQQQQRYSSSYVPQITESDWMIDGKEEWDHDAILSYHLLKELYPSSSHHHHHHRTDDNDDNDEYDDENGDDDEYGHDDNDGTTTSSFLRSLRELVQKQHEINDRLIVMVPSSDNCDHDGDGDGDDDDDDFGEFQSASHHYPHHQPTIVAHLPPKLLLSVPGNEYNNSNNNNKNDTNQGNAEDDERDNNNNNNKSIQQQQQQQQISILPTQPAITSSMNNPNNNTCTSEATREMENSNNDPKNIIMLDEDCIENDNADKEQGWGGHGPGGIIILPGANNNTPDSAWTNQMDDDDEMRNMEERVVDDFQNHQDIPNNHIDDVDLIANSNDEILVIDDEDDDNQNNNDGDGNDRTRNSSPSDSTAPMSQWDTESTIATTSHTTRYSDWFHRRNSSILSISPSNTYNNNTAIPGNNDPTTTTRINSFDNDNNNNENNPEELEENHDNTSTPPPLSPQELRIRSKTKPSSLSPNDAVSVDDVPDSVHEDDHDDENLEEKKDDHHIVVAYEATSKKSYISRIDEPAVKITTRSDKTKYVSETAMAEPNKLQTYDDEEEDEEESWMRRADQIIRAHDGCGAGTGSRSLDSSSTLDTPELLRRTDLMMWATLIASSPSDDEGIVVEEAIAVKEDAGGTDVSCHKNNSNVVLSESHGYDNNHVIIETLVPNEENRRLCREEESTPPDPRMELLTPTPAEGTPVLRQLHRDTGFSHHPSIHSQRELNLDTSHERNEPTRISMLLPLDDISTLEGRFTRRMQLEYDQSMSAASAINCTNNDILLVQASNKIGSVLESSSSSSVTMMAKELDIPSVFFDHTDIDYTTGFLKSLPWGYFIRKGADFGFDFDEPSRPASPESVKSRTTNVKDDCGLSNEILWDEFCTAQLCHLDEALAKVQSELLRNVQPNECKIQQASQYLHDFDQNLRLAFMYYNRSKDSISLATHDDIEGGGIVDGPTTLLHLWDRQDEYKQLEYMLGKVSDVWTREQELLHRINAFDARIGNALDEYFNARKMAAILEQDINSKTGSALAAALTSLKCLDDVRSRLSSIDQRFWTRLLTLSESVIVRCCRNTPFDFSEYDSLLRAVLDLQGSRQYQHHQLAGLSNHDFDWILSWTDNAVAALTYEAERAFTVALLEPSPAWNSEEQDLYDEKEFLRELSQLNNEVDLDWGDFVKLRSLTHILVTIRFDAETARGNYLPRVYHKLCKQLVSVLNAYAVFIEWHKLHDCKYDNVLGHATHIESILSKLFESKEHVWDICENVLAKCLDEYLCFASKRVLFKINEADDVVGSILNDSAWIQDLEGLHQVLLLTNLFMSLKRVFLGKKEFAIPGEEEKAGSDVLQHKEHNFESISIIYGKIVDLCRINLQAIHINAMNTTGKRLATETWILKDFDGSPEVIEKTNEDHPPTVNILLAGLISASSLYRTSAAAGSSPFFIMGTEESSFPLKENPFYPLESEFTGIQVDSLRSASDAAVDTQEKNGEMRTEVHRALTEMIMTSETGGVRRIAPDAVTCELCGWFARLLSFLEKLPLIVEEVAVVFANLCDLHFTTVLRLCAGNAKNERILLGIDKLTCLPLVGSDDRKPLPGMPENSASPMFRPFLPGKPKKSTNTKIFNRSSALISLHIEAEICAPLIKDTPSIVKLKNYVQRAQNSLHKVVNLDMVDSWLVGSNHADESAVARACEVTRLLEKRIGAAWSCYAVAALLDVACAVARDGLAKSSAFYNRGTFNRFDFVYHLHPLEDLVSEVLSVTTTLVSLATEISCVRAISGTEVVKDIVEVGRGWDEHTLHENHNEYVENLCDRGALLWGFLSNSAKLPLPTLKATWESIIKGSYMSLLEGFSRIHMCSTEGRALMTLDLASLSAGVSSPSIQQRLQEDDGDGRSSLFQFCKRPHADGTKSRVMMQYVDMYLKVFYYPLDDAMKWIDENHTTYRFDHAVALILAIFNTMTAESTSLDLLVEHIKGSYSMGD